MIERRAAICRICFAISVVLGAFFLGMVLIEGVMPYAWLDAVLTPEELRDQATHDKTLEILIKAGGNRWVIWAFAGVATISAGSVGYWDAGGKAAVFEITP